MSPRGQPTSAAKLQAADYHGFTSPEIKVSVNVDKGAKTVGKKPSGYRSLERSQGKVTSMRRRNQRNFLPASSGAEVTGDVLRQSQKDVPLRLPEANSAMAMRSNNIVELAA